MRLSFFKATPLTKASRVRTEAASESQSEQSESWFTERIFSSMARQTSEPFQWFIFRQTLHLSPYARHSSFFRTWDCGQNFHLSFRGSVFFSSNEGSVRSPRLRIFLERSLALRSTRLTTSCFPTSAWRWVVARSEVQQMSIHLFRSSFQSWSNRFLASRFWISRTIRSRSNESLIACYRSYKFPLCFSRRWDQRRSFHRLFDCSG